MFIKLSLFEIQLKDISKNTLYVVIMASVIVGAAGTWAMPLFVAETTHSIIQSNLTDMEKDIKDKVSEGDAKIFGSGFDQDKLQGCDMMDMMMAMAMDQDLKMICGEAAFTNMESEFIKGGQHYDDMKNKFVMEEKIMETHKTVILPARECNDEGGSPNADLTDIDIMLYDLSGSENSSDRITSNTTANSLSWPPTCIHAMAMDDNPLELVELSVRNFGGDAQVRVQLGMVTDPDDTQGTSTSSTVAEMRENCIASGWSAESNFDGVAIFDQTTFIAANQTAIIPFADNVNLPPKASTNLCVRIADDSTAANQYSVYLQAEEVTPMTTGGIFKFQPDETAGQYTFETMAPMDMSSLCGIRVLVKDDGGNVLSGIPVTILNPPIAGVGGTGGLQLTNATGYAHFGVGTQITGVGSDEKMPSGFYVIDINVPDSQDWTSGVAHGASLTTHDLDNEGTTDTDHTAPATNVDHVNETYSPAFADQTIKCSSDDGTGNDAIGNDGNVDILVTLTNFGSASNLKSMIFKMSDSQTFADVTGATLTLTGTDFGANAITFANDDNSDGNGDQTTWIKTGDSDGKATFDGLPMGKYTLSVSKTGYTTQTYTEFIDPHAPSIMQITKQITPT